MHLPIRPILKRELYTRKVVVAFVVGVLVFVLGVAVAVEKEHARDRFIALEKLRQQQAEIKTRWTQLLLEEAMWSSSDLIYRTATQKYEMDMPDKWHIKEVGIPADLEPENEV